MSERLDKQRFAADLWHEVQSFDCGEKPHERKVSDWLKAPVEDDGALKTISGGRPFPVWLYRSEAGDIVGFGSLTQTEWRYPGKNDPRIPVSIVPWFGVDRRFRGTPGDDRSQH